MDKAKESRRLYHLAHFTRNRLLERLNEKINEGKSGWEELEFTTLMNRIIDNAYKGEWIDCMAYAAFAVIKKEGIKTDGLD